MTDVDNMIIINKKKYEMYKLSLENAVAILNVDEKRKLVNSGEIGGYKVSVSIPLGYTYYLTREQGLTNDFSEVEPWAIINSPFNREPFIDDERTLIKKVVYLMRTLWGVSDFNFLPVSLISDPHNNEEADIIMHDCLLAKDRGHFMTILKMFVNDERLMDASFWRKVRQKLIAVNNEKGDTPKSLKKFTNVEFKKLLSTKDEFTLKDVLPKNVYDRIWEQEENVQIRLETIATHKAEIRAINVQDNDWTDHNHALTELTDVLIKKDSWGYSQLKVDKLCSENAVLRGEHPSFLSSRRSKNFSGYTTEPVMLFVASLKQKVAKGIYQFLGKPESDLVYVDSISKHNIPTEEISKWSKRFTSVAALTSSNGVNLWTRLNDVISQHYENWKATEGKQDSGFDKVKGSSMDTALLYNRMVVNINEELGISRDRESSFHTTMTEFIEFIIDYIETQPDKYEASITKAQSWQSREKHFFLPIMEDFIKDKKSKQQGIIPATKLKKNGMKNIRTMASSYGMPMKFKMFDRRRRNGWEIVEIDLEAIGEKSGLQLSHYTSEANGGLYTEENTFMGPALDNNYKDKDNVEKNHLHLDGEFFTHFKEDVEQPTDILSEEMEAYLNTKKFCEMIQNG